MSSSFKLCPTHFSRGEKFFQGRLRPPWLRTCLEVKVQHYKTLSAVFHHNKKVKREHKAKFNNETLLLGSEESKCLGVTLNRTLKYLRHLESLRKKLASRVALVR